MKNSNKYLGLPWLLAESLRSLNFNLESSIHARTNLVSLIYSITTAIIDADRKKLTDTDRETLDGIGDNIDDMRQTYEPIMDDKDSIEATVHKRTSYEQLLDLSTKQLMYIVHKYELVDASMIGEVDASQW